MPTDEAFRECVAIVRLLLNLDEKYKKLRKLAIDDSPTFWKEVGSFARGHSRASESTSQALSILDMISSLQRSSFSSILVAKFLSST